MALQRPTFNSQIHTYLPQETMVWHFQVFFPLEKQRYGMIVLSVGQKVLFGMMFCNETIYLFCPDSLIDYCFNQNSLWTIHYGISNISTDFCPSDRTQQKGHQILQFSKFGEKESVFFAEGGRMQSSWSNNGDLSKTLLMLSQKYKKLKLEA